MRLFRTDTLRAMPLPDGGFEAESRHLRSLLGAGRRVTSVEIPTIYDGEPSHFRPVADTVAVARALLGAPRAHDRPDPAPRPLAVPVLREWGPRLAVSMGAVLAIGAALPALAAARQPALPRGQRPRRRPRVALPGPRPAHPQLHRALPGDAHRGRRGPAAPPLRDRRRRRRAAGRLPRRRGARGR